MKYINVIYLVSGSVMNNFLFAGEAKDVVILAERKFLQMARKLRDIEPWEESGYLEDGYCIDADEVREVCINYPEVEE
jgi:hypothetical protein